MSNHFHPVVETPQPNLNLVAGMKWFLGTYTGRFNRRHRLGGHLFSGRYKSLIVGGSGSGYLRTVCEYVHLNPSRAKLLAPEQALREYRWSSWLEYLRRPRQRSAWLRVDRLLGELGLPKDSAAVADGEQSPCQHPAVPLAPEKPGGVIHKIPFQVIKEYPFIRTLAWMGFAFFIALEVLVAPGNELRQLLFPRHGNFIPTATPDVSNDVVADRE